MVLFSELPENGYLKLYNFFIYMRFFGIFLSKTTSGLKISVTDDRDIFHCGLTTVEI